MNIDFENLLDKYMTIDNRQNDYPVVHFIKSLDPNRLQEHIKTAASAHSAAQKIFEEQVPELATATKVCLTYTGSDGRDEKINRSSNIEIQLIFSSRKDFDDSLLSKINDIVANDKSIFHPELEVLFLDSDNLLMYNRNRDINGVKNERPFPTRALDSKRLAGSCDIFARYKEQFQSELMKDSSAKQLRKFRSSALYGSRKVLRQCIEEKSGSLDLSTGIASYDGKRIKGVKYPLLRVVQYKLADLLIKLMKSGDAAIGGIPRSTIERIDFLAQKSLLGVSKEEAEDLKLSYARSLLWYAASEEAYARFSKKAVRLDPKELEETANQIHEFSKKVLK